MKKTMLLLVLLSLTGCYKDPESTTPAGRGFEVEKLFTVDNCTVYRFSDGGRAVYFSNCKGRTDYEYTTPNGKSSSTHKMQSFTEAE